MESYTVEVLTLNDDKEEWWLVRENTTFGVAMKTAREINDFKARVRVVGGKQRPDFSGYPVELFSARELKEYYQQIDSNTEDTHKI